MLIEIAGIHYHTHRKGAGSPLVCLHGFSENINTWNCLQLENCELILVDLVGHGASDKPQAGKYYRVNIMLRHLHKLMNRLGLRKYSLLGYSLGGRIALAYALAYPQEVDKLILESASYGECGWLNRLKRRRSDSYLARSICRNGIEWFNAYWSDLSIFTSQKNLPAATGKEIRERRMQNTAHALANTLLGSGQGSFPCLKNKIAELSMPVLYISGEHDEKYRQAGHEFSQLNPHIKHEIIKGVGHNTHLEDGQAFTDILQKFLSIKYAKKV
ncbi:2-succinyl-6-hydroxy-2,4-cyclohexadiene-1-carboxylate synthase [Sporomusa termitida]|uniref:Putative 2-succinyl-6-hydroxy-2,4-cyclohexadiene-1-carboxylate synthase n=1 Tax=Sporomusa termitida TaxID=2377 RepID=A0A517DRG2_9FIRM|nr:2-succinyl-6-hydroxy-2,4-cyclohexadiene-1-carboxylate synthase [Sporomusa termitida]QDR79907.1 2-succinyl-6-hydroxy-2,4-cyclohexadiene-1-carboxylate synthase [Sporomusa termitida]